MSRITYTLPISFEPDAIERLRSLMSEAEILQVAQAGVDEAIANALAGRSSTRLRFDREVEGIRVLKRADGSLSCPWLDVTRAARSSNPYMNRAKWNTAQAEYVDRDGGIRGGLIVSVEDAIKYLRSRRVFEFECRAAANKLAEIVS